MLTISYSRARIGIALALAVSIAVFGFAASLQKTHADVDPSGCTDNGGGVSLAAFRADGTTNIGSGTVSDGEAINYKATLSALAAPNCAFQGGTWTLTTPDGVSHALGAVPRIGGTGVASISSALIPYTVNHANEIVNSTRHIDAITNYSGGISHADVGDETPGPSLSTSKILKVIHSSAVTTNIHDPNHSVITSAPIGSSVHDNAVVTVGAGGPAPSGTIDFYRFNNSECVGDFATQSGVALTKNSTSTASAESSSSTVPSTGLSYKAHYNGDGNYTSSTGACEPLAATKLGSQTVTVIYDAAEHVVTSTNSSAIVHDKATVTGSGPTPTGNVDFTFYTNNVCNGSSTSAGTVALVSGVAHPSLSEGPLSAGSYSFKALYNGDATYASSTGACEPLTVTSFTARITTTIHDASHATTTSVVAGSSVHDSARVTGAGPTPTGNVSFEFYTGPGISACEGTGVSAGTVALVNGVADPSATEGPLAVGHYYFEATYAGDSNYPNGATSECEPLTVTPKQPTLGTTPNPASGDVGVVLNDSAVLSGAFNPTGSITFNLFSPSDATCSASSTYTQTVPLSGNTASTNPGFTSNAAGTWHWTANYPGDINNASSSSSCEIEPVTVNQPAGQWCSHGYWKQSQHFDNWVNYSPNQLFSSVFDNAFPGKTLLQVLKQGGGGLNALGRDTVGELLNSGKMNTGFTQAQVISMFNAVFPGTKSEYDALHAQFVAPENCPLD